MWTPVRCRHKNYCTDKAKHCFHVTCRLLEALTTALNALEMTLGMHASAREGFCNPLQKVGLTLLLKKLIHATLSIYGEVSTPPPPPPLTCSVSLLCVHSHIHSFMHPYIHPSLHPLHPTTQSRPLFLHFSGSSGGLESCLPGNNRHLPGNLHKTRKTYTAIHMPATCLCIKRSEGCVDGFHTRWPSVPRLSKGATTRGLGALACTCFCIPTMHPFHPFLPSSLLPSWRNLSSQLGSHLSPG